MAERMDLSILDRPEILEVIFPVAYSSFYSPDDAQTPVLPVPTCTIEVAPDIKINCGFWVNNKESPSILYFHGNGETVADYPVIARLYHRRGINLFVADYRGYGASGGQPTITNMLGDAHTIFSGFTEIVARQGLKPSLFLMGRSLGSIPAIELAFHHQDQICGLLIESGTANNFRRLWYSLGIAGQELGEDSPFLNKVKIRQVHQPTLIIHGENDQIIPVEEGIELYDNSGAQDKRILIIPGADHNDVMLIKQSLYFEAIKELVKTCA